MTFEKVTIIGLGLIGGSLARALRDSNTAGEVYGVDVDQSSIDYALSEGIIDAGSTDIIKGVQNADIIVIATYVGTIAKTAESFIASAREGSIITDVGSVKGDVVREIEEILPPGVHFIGGHPIAGNENSGVRAAVRDLYKGKRCILTPTQKTDPDAISKVTALWESVGCDVYTLDPDTHDRILGFVSHLPHIVAYSLINSVISSDNPDELFNFAGGGLKDYTRIAASSPEMWTEIFRANKTQVLEAIKHFKSSLESIEEAIENEDKDKLISELQKAAGSRRSMD